MYVGMNLFRLFLPNQDGVELSFILIFAIALHDITFGKWVLGGFEGVVFACFPVSHEILFESTKPALNQSKQTC